MIKKDNFICPGCKDIVSPIGETRITDDGEYFCVQWGYYLACQECIKIYLTIRKHLTGVKEYQRDSERAI